MGIVNRLVRLGARVGTGKYCCICKSEIGMFIPYRMGKRPPLMNALNVIGSDVKNFTCPACLCHDRERHLFLFMEKLKLFEKFEGRAILHFAPELRLSDIITRTRPAVYKKGDLYPSREGIEKIDMLDIPYEGEAFDFVIANHVLEHVPDDLVALAELRRILKPGGHAILQTPFSPLLVSTFSDPGITSTNARLHAYGQEDHVRLYGADIFSRIESVGFVSRLAMHNDVLNEFDSKKYGVNEYEPFFLFERV